MKPRATIILSAIAVLLLAACASQPDTDLSETPWPQIVEQARWAANAHNVQSWRMRTASGTELVGGLEPGRLLPETDPIGRQLVLSLGALTAAAQAAALELGYELISEWIGGDWTLAEDPGADLFRWNLSPTSPTAMRTLDGLTSATVKYRMPPGEIDAAYAARLQTEYTGPGYEVLVESGTDRVSESVRLAIASFETEMLYEPTARESLDLTRIGSRARREYPYGITLRGNFRAGLFWIVDSMAALFPQSLEQYAGSSIGLFTPAVEHSQSLVVLRTEQNAPSAWFEAGQALQLVWMDVRAEGYELLPLSQGLQEYAQVSEYYAAFQDLWAPEGGTVQMVMHVGRPSGRFGTSPRLPVAEILDYGLN